MSGVPYIFANATTSIPLNQLDTNFATPVTIGNTTVALGNTVTSIGNLTLTNVTISSGTSNISTNVANVTGILVEANGGTGTTTGYYGFKNRIINGAMGIWQRGTSGFTTSGAYGADRWFVACGGTISAGAQSSDAPAGFPYSYSFTSTGFPAVTQRIEAKNCYDFSGATVTISFWAKQTSGAGSNSIALQLFYATATDNFASTTQIGSTATFTGTASWSQYTVSFSGLPSGVLNGIQLNIVSNASGSTTTLITGVQLEKGSTATSFDYRPYGTELALCQRYYWRNGGSAQGGLYAPFATGVNTSTANFSTVVQFPVRMRAAPSFAVGGSSPVIANGTYSSVTLDRVSLDQILLAINLTGATNGAANRYLGNSDGTTYWEFPAEL